MLETLAGWGRCCAGGEGGKLLGELAFLCGAEESRLTVSREPWKVTRGNTGGDLPFREGIKAGRELQGRASASQTSLGSGHRGDDDCPRAVAPRRKDGNRKQVDV